MTTQNGCTAGMTANGWRALLGREVTVVRDRHGYKVRGEYFRRVTTLLGGIPKPGLTGWAARTVAEYAVEHRAEWEGLPASAAVKLLKQAAWRRRDEAGDRGTAIHTAVEAFLHGATLRDELTAEEANCALAAEAFLRQHVREVLAVELTVFSPTFMYAGTLDLWALGRGGKRCVLDWKSSGRIYTDHAVQLAAYANAEFAVIDARPITGSGEAWKGKLIEWGPGMMERLGVVHVRPDGATLYPVNYTSRLWHVFRAAAFTKIWQLDTDDHKRAPREHVFGKLVELRPETSNAAQGRTPWPSS